MSDELARRPPVRFERPESFTPGKGEAKPKTQPELPKTEDNLPRGRYVVLADAWGREVFIPLLNIEHQFGMTYGQSTFTAEVRGVVAAGDEVYRRNYEYLRQATVEFQVDDSSGPGIVGRMFDTPYLP